MTADILHMEGEWGGRGWVISIGREEEYRPFFTPWKKKKRIVKRLHGTEEDDLHSVNVAGYPEYGRRFFVKYYKSRIKAEVDAKKMGLKINNPCLEFKMF